MCDLCAANLMLQNCGEIAAVIVAKTLQKYSSITTFCEAIRWKMCDYCRKKYHTAPLPQNVHTIFNRQKCEHCVSFPAQKSPGYRVFISSVPKEVE